MPISINQVNWESNLEQLKAIRSSVFIIEQQVSTEEEWDEHDADKNTLHYLIESNKQAIGTARVILNRKELSAKIGRVAILQSYRGHGYASALMKHIISDLKALNTQTTTLDSQTYICSLYEKLSFEAQGNTFMDAGIEHQKMVLQLF